MGKDLQTDFLSVRKPRNLEVKLKHLRRGSLNPRQAERNELKREEAKENNKTRRGNQDRNQDGNLDGNLELYLNYHTRYRPLPSDGGKPIIGVKHWDYIRQGFKSLFCRSCSTSLNQEDYSIPCTFSLQRNQTHQYSIPSTFNISGQMPYWVTSVKGPKKNREKKVFSKECDHPYASSCSRPYFCSTTPFIEHVMTCHHNTNPYSLPRLVFLP
ncbi:hypothetical protein PDIG_79420 [Penicillium digitatum PHI26]|uniref:Uncharacterized protein n=2 Tax=Penicillium digitatum TaxID=36651 RepID=K9FAE3_PEND2|nr:hypothetical protein PDIP_27810 [Penicillium digitatum Pd1]EKV06164.1 hypothetical protein PDIG_79420 [Penicillium digitatum PHI26]EKV18233.1 hypothetical protein PDIP_27810 [Penicillium digitatum Pd1]